jgi:antitoxin (DNA-binding transcriptional repressor) of toxin-antitoxin stability system
MDMRAEVSETMKVADARANFTELISRVRLLRWTVFLVNRRTPMAALVPIELGELIRRAGGADQAAAILEAHLGPAPEDDEGE